MTTSSATQIRLAKNTPGIPDASFWNFTHDPVEAPKEGEVKIKLHYISIDPAMRGWMTPIRSYMPPVQIGEVMRAFGIGEVIESKNNQFAVGDFVHGFTGVQTEASLDATFLRKLNLDDAPLDVQMGGLGWPGFTGYFGMTDICNPQPGDVVVVSGASGAVGEVACQVAKYAGAYVIGIAGGEKKCAYLRDELNLNAVIDYKNDDVKAKLKEVAPKGVDVYFDNVGGDTLNTVLGMIRYKARIAVCGAISQYANMDKPQGPGNYMKLISSSGTMRGFTMKDYLMQIPEASQQLATWYNEGQLKVQTHVVDGIENFADTLQMLFHGKNFGKLMVKL